MKLRSILLSVIATVVAVGFAAPAMAVSWGTLTAYEGGVAQAKGYGNFYNSGGIYAQNDSQQYDLKPGGNSVTVKTHYMFFKTCNGTPNQWCDAGTVQTPGSTSASWYGAWTRKPLDPVSTQGRGGIIVCEVQDWSGDPCSVQAIATFSY